jgi:hypothetical protein
MQNLNSKLLQKVSTKPKYSTSENIIYYAFSFGACFILLYALCYTLTLIDKITL